MTERATFGDFAMTVTRQLGQLRPRGTGPSAGSRSAETAADIAAGARSAVHAMAGYARDICGVLDALPAADRRQLGPWMTAASKARQSLATAEAFLQAGAFNDSHTSDNRQAAPPAVGVGAAAKSMTLGRDLLHTHLRMRAAQATRGGSEWAPVVTSPPIACALLHQVGGWVRQLAPHVGDIAFSGRGITAGDRRNLTAACQSLWLATWAVGLAQERQPVPADQFRLLRAIPVNTLAPGHMPVGGEAVTTLCDGVVSTAERLRAAARRAAAQAAWSPALTRESLRQTAGSCAVTASNLRIVLRTLVAEHGRPCAPLSASLADAAVAVDSARAAWLRVAEAWDAITTDTRDLMSAAAAEATSLALWTGRLAYAGPDWTPSLGPRHQPRAAAELAASPDQLRHVIDAAHHSCHTLTQVAEAECSQVRTAAMTGRLIVPTRSLPESFDIPYRFAPAPGTRVAPLQSSYDLALQASEEATSAIAEVAAEIRAPSRILSTYRVALQSGDRTPVDGRLPGRPEVSARTPGREPRTSPPTPARRPQPVPPGPVERILLDLDITNPSDLKQAAAFDNAADQLILRATATARPPQPGRDLSRSAGAAELITHLLAASGDRVPAALQPSRTVEIRPGANAGLRARTVTRAQQIASHSSGQRADAEPEAGA